MATEVAKLQVSVVEGKGLKAADGAASADPYVRLTLGTVEVRQARSKDLCQVVRLSTPAALRSIREPPLHREASAREALCWYQVVSSPLVNFEISSHNR